jgi:hypothetical protein
MIGAVALAGLAFAACDAPGPSSDSASSGAAATQQATTSIAEALQDPDPYARARSLGALLPTLGSESLPEVKEALDNFRLDLGAVEFELLLRFWASQEPAEATAWTFKHASPLYRTTSARTVVEIWAKADPTAALVAVEDALPQSDEEVARVVQMSLVRGWFKADRPGLEQYIYSLGSGLKRQRAIFSYLLSLAAAEGSDAAIAWAEAISEEDVRYKLAVYRQLMSALAWADTDAAMRFCDVHCDGPYGKGLRNVLVRKRLRDGENGGEIVEWVARVPETSERQRENKTHSLWVAYSTWAYRERQAAMAWMRDQIAAEEPEPWLPLLYAEYARQLAPDSPEEAIGWAERVEDENDRERTLVRIARAWRKQDESAAEAWLAQSSLSERARAQARDTSQPTYLPQDRPR